MAAVVKSLLRGKTLIQAILSYWLSGNKKGKETGAQKKTLQQFLKDAEAALVGPISGDGLQELSVKLKQQILDALQADVQCMLPSYSHQLPVGSEYGQFLALDVGGSTLRVALVELRGREKGSENATEIVSMQNYRITKEVKDLEGIAFFEWMAARITETIQTTLNREHSVEKPLPVSMAWSFPIEYVFLFSSCGCTLFCLYLYLIPKLTTKQANFPRWWQACTYGQRLFGRYWSCWTRFGGHR